MLGKLMKYDIKKMMQVLIYIYAISLGLACITRLINIGKNIQAVAIIGYVFSGLTYSALGSIIVNTFVHIIKVFIVNFYKDESYLTHTLPIKKSKLMLSKYLSSVVVILASVAVCALSLFIMFYSKTNMQILETFIKLTVQDFNISVGVFITLVVLIIFAQICSLISFSFAAIVKANTYNHKRVFKGLCWFALFYFGSMICTILVAVVVFAIGGMLPELMAEQLSQTAFITIMFAAFILYIAYSIIFYFIAQKLFNKGVNVD